MELDELKLKVVELTEEVATLRKYLSEISTSLLAVRRSLEEVTPEKSKTVYNAHFAAQDSQLIRSGLILRVTIP
jgi:hypothetical protein